MSSIATGPDCTTCVAPARNGAPSISPGQGSILKPYRRVAARAVPQRMCAVATRLTPPDSRPRLRNHALDTGVLVCRLAFDQPGDNLEGRILGVRPHLPFRPSTVEKGQHA